MRKRIFSIFLVLILCVQLLPAAAFAADEAGSPKHIPRVVSIVFDDSGSMYKNTDRWAYTSYAMQCFAAMMGSEDVLYVTYLNGPAGTVKVDLSNGAKKATVDSFSQIVFGGSTPNKIQQGADCLTKEYASHKTNAKYYLVVMADGELDSGLGQLSDKIANAAASTKAALAGADVETIYFSMKGYETIPGVSTYSAQTSEEIASVLRDVSADIMGRTAVEYTVSGGTLSFTLEYPALSIAVFAQEKNGDFRNFRTSIKKDGRPLSCQVGDYSVKCPTEIKKNPNSTMYTEVIPTDPPAGVVSLITNSGGSLAKGTYTVDISGYGLLEKDIVVLVEPAVRIGCKYFLNNDDAEITFEELKSRVAEGDTVTVVCGLYELNPDGTLGDAVPLDVLSPDYGVSVNGKQVGSGTGNTFAFTVDKSFENQQMKVEARLEGYQPFVLKETFGKLNIHIKPLPGGNDKNEVTLTKPLWKKWSEGQEGISFQLEKADASVLERTAIAVEGVDGLPAGICSALGNAVKVVGSTIVYLPMAQQSFAQLPETFTVSLVDLNSAKPILTKVVKVIQPTYRFEIDNPLANVTLNLNMLKTNTQAVRFTLKVDYDGSGRYIKVSDSDCEENISLTPDIGVLPGTVTEENGVFAFVPKYDPAVDTQVSVADLVGKKHSVSVSAQVDGKKIQSDAVTLAFSSANYRIETENEITAPLSLDTVKTNQKKVIFKLLADYNGSGTFGDLAQWDTGAIDLLLVDAGGLPGRVETVYDAGGKPIGKAFIPQYDENNNNGIPFTAVAGKTHEIVATVSGTDVRAAASVEVLAPDYDIIVRKQNIVITDVKLRDNTESVAFTVLRDDRILTQQELENLSSYELGFDKAQPWIRIETKVEVAEDGTAYLTCTPKYGGWDFISSWLWNWLCLFNVKKGDMHLTMVLGTDVAAAAVTVETSQIAWIIFIAVAGVLLLILWIMACYFTRVRIRAGSFYVVSVVQSQTGLGYEVDDVLVYPSNSKSLLRFFASSKWFWFRSEQRMSVPMENRSAVFRSNKSELMPNPYKSKPYSIAKENQEHFGCGFLATATIRKIVQDDPDLELSSGLLTGARLPDDADRIMDFGDYLVEHGSKRIIFFLTKEDEKEMME